MCQKGLDFDKILSIMCVFTNFLRFLMSKFTPNKMENNSVLAALRKCFVDGCTDREACLIAGVSVATLVVYQRNHPEFVAEKEMLKSTPIYKARKIIIKAIDAGDLDIAKWYLERKKKDEFALKQPETTLNLGEVIVIDLDSEEPSTPVDVSPTALTIEQATDD